MEQFRLSVQRNLGLLCLCFTLLYDWSRKLASLSQPIRCGTITNNCLVVRVFPRFRQFDYFYCAFSLALWVFSFLFLFFSFFFFFPHVSRAQRLAPARTRTRVVRLGAQCTDHWTTGQSRGVGVPAVQLTTHVKSSTLYGRTSKFFRLDGLLLFCIIMELRSASSAIILWYPVSSANPNSAEFNAS